MAERKSERNTGKKNDIPHDTEDIDKCERPSTSREVENRNEPEITEEVGLVLGEMYVSRKSADKDNTHQQTRIERDEFHEEQIDTNTFKKDETKKTKSHYCDVCLSRNKSLKNTRFGAYLCTFCEKYFCPECFTGHEDHNVIELNGGEEEINQAIEAFINIMLDEGVDRERLLHAEDICVIDRINLWHPLDVSEPKISGICGLGNKRWIVCDGSNDSIKVYEIRSNTLIKYIRFRSDVWGVTEVMHPEYQATGNTFNSESGDRSSSNEKCALAVSLPMINRIIILGMDDNPVSKIGSLRTPDTCGYIHYFNGQLFLYGRGRIYIMTLHGEILKEIPVGVIQSPSFFCVAPGRIYLTDYYKDRVMLINFNGVLLSSKKVQSLKPRGLTVDESGNVYVSSRKCNSIFKLDKDLTKLNIQTLCDKTNLSSPARILWYREKLFASHSLYVSIPKESPLTIMQLT